MEEKKVLLSPKALSKSVHHIRIRLSNTLHKLLREEVRKHKLNNSPTNQSKIIMDAIEKEYFSNRSINFPKNESLRVVTTVYFNSYAMQLMFELESRYDVTQSRLIDRLLRDHFKV